MSRSRVCAIAAAAFLAFAFGACSDGGDSGPARTNLLLVSLDTVRADHTSLLGYSRPTTPRLTALARQGVSFRQAYAMTSTTGPSHGTLFTGRYAPAHGVARNGMPLVEEATTLAEHLSVRGYRTAGVLGSFVLSQRFGFGQGFAEWDDAFRRETSSQPFKHWEGHAVPDQAFDRAGEETTRLATQWLRRHGSGAPFFLFVHYFDAHEPYTPRPHDVRRLAVAPLGPVGDPETPGATPKDIERYDAEIAGVDRELGVLLDALDDLGLAGRTLVVVTSDHGQGLSDHDDSQHGVNIYEESVRAVLVFRGPGVAPAGRTSDAPVEAVDVFPTLLDQLAPGSHRNLGLPGRSLAPFLSGAAELDAERPVFLFRQHYPRRRRERRTVVEGSEFGVRVGRWKYIEGDPAGRRELYDLSRDPGERQDLSGQEPERLAELRARILAWRTENRRPGGRPPALSEDDRARLRALGYAE